MAQPVGPVRTPFSACRAIGPVRFSFLSLFRLILAYFFSRGTIKLAEISRLLNQPNRHIAVSCDLSRRLRRCYTRTLVRSPAITVTRCCACTDRHSTSYRKAHSAPPDFDLQPAALLAAHRRPSVPLESRRKNGRKKKGCLYITCDRRPALLYICAAHRSLLDACT